MSDFRKLRVWQAARELAGSVNNVAPRITNLDLRNQIVRAALSVPSNIAEGSGHGSSKEFKRFLRYALASASEVEGHSQIAFDFGYIDAAEFDRLSERVSATRMMLYGLIKKLGG